MKHIDPRIRDRAPRHTSLHFQIPGILWGQPVFDANRVERMIVRHYKSIGFKCVRLGEREIIIKWGEDESEDTEAARGADDASTQSESEGETDSSVATDSTESTESSDAGTTDSETSDSSEDDDDADKTKCVTVEQIPLSKRLSIVNNQMQRNM